MGDMFDKVQFSDRDYTDIVMKNPDALWFQRAVSNAARTKEGRSVYTTTIETDGRYLVIPTVRLDEKSGKLCFQNPNPHSIVTDYTIDPSPNILCYKVKPGDLFIFPGWLQHGSNYELSKSEERIVLSFNCKNIEI